MRGQQAIIKTSEKQRATHFHYVQQSPTRVTDPALVAQGDCREPAENGIGERNEIGTQEMRAGRLRREAVKPARRTPLVCAATRVLEKTYAGSTSGAHSLHSPELNSQPDSQPAHIPYSETIFTHPFTPTRLTCRQFEISPVFYK